MTWIIIKTVEVEHVEYVPDVGQTILPFFFFFLKWGEDIWQQFAFLSQDPSPVQFATVYSSPSDAAVLFLSW